MGSVNWHKDRVILKVKGATQKALNALAAQVEAEAKINIQNNNQIDTGFMWNSVYTVTKESSGYAQTRSTGNYPWSPEKHGGKAGLGYRELAPEFTLPRSNKPVVAIVVGARYAVYREIKNSFLYKALVTVAQKAGGIIQTVARKEMHD